MLESRPADAAADRCIRLGLRGMRDIGDARLVAEACAPFRCYYLLKQSARLGAASPESIQGNKP